MFMSHLVSRYVNNVGVERTIIIGVYRHTQHTHTHTHAYAHTYTDTMTHMLATVMTSPHFSGPTINYILKY